MATNVANVAAPKNMANSAYHLNLPGRNTNQRFMSQQKTLAMMKPTAILINSSRGPVVDEKALVEALKKRTIWAAGLDVYENEPDVEPGLKDLDNVALAPHLGTATTGTRYEMGLMVVRNVDAALNGQVPPNKVK